MRESDVLARLGGDEFGILLENCSLEHGARIAEGVLESVGGFRFAWQEKSFVVGASIGLVEIAGSDLGTADAARRRRHRLLCRQGRRPQPHPLLQRLRQRDDPTFR